MNSYSCNISSLSRSAALAFLFAASFAITAHAESNDAKPPVPHASARAPAHAPSPAVTKPYAPPRYASPHWQLDNRYHHDRYYPARGYVVGSLPPGHIDIAFGGVHYFHHGGVWFRARGPRFVVIAPPFGIVIPLLPFGYSTLWVGPEPYYYAADVYYVRAAGGYRVVAPPPANEVIIEEPVPASVAITPPPATTYAAPPAVIAAPAAIPTPSYQQPAKPTQDDTLFVYPKSGQTATQTSYDRIECDRWAIGQTGYDPALPSADPFRRGGFMRAAAACLEGRGYTVK